MMASTVDKDEQIVPQPEVMRDLDQMAQKSEVYSNSNIFMTKWTSIRSRDFPSQELSSS